MHNAGSASRSYNFSQCEHDWFYIIVRLMIKVFTVHIMRALGVILILIVVITG